MKLNVYRFVVFSATLAYSFGTSLSLADEKLPDYQPASLKSESLTSIGSDVMDTLMEPWVAAYQKLQPQVQIEIFGSGSASAPAALLEGHADLAPMVRPLKSLERDTFLAKFGYEPTQVKTAFTAVVIYVAKSNPIEKLSFADLDALYSMDRRQGGARTIQTWKDLGVVGPLGEKAVSAIAQLEGSPFDSFFRQQVLLLGDMKPSVVRVSDTSAVFEVLAANPSAIGFGTLVSPIPAGIRIVPVSRKEGDRAIRPTIPSIVSNDYPLARSLNVYVVRSPGKPLEIGVEDFLHFVLSRQGQEIVSKEGMIPLPASIAQEELAKLQ